MSAKQTIEFEAAGATSFPVEIGGAVLAQVLYVHGSGTNGALTITDRNGANLLAVAGAQTANAGLQLNGTALDYPPFIGPLTVTRADASGAGTLTLYAI